MTIDYLSRPIMSAALDTGSSFLLVSLECQLAVSLVAYMLFSNDKKIGIE